jgi:hypothetical protein
LGLSFSVVVVAFKVEMEKHRKVMEEYKKSEEYKAFQANKKAKKFKKRPKDKKAPKKPQTAYFVFCNAKRNEIKASLENPTMAAVSKKMGEMWGALDAEGRAPYQKINEEQKAAYAEAWAKYKETEAYREHQEKLEKFQEAKARAYGGRRKKSKKNKVKREN